MTNSDRLQEIRERAEKATAGPWKKTGPWHPLEPKTRKMPDEYSNVQTPDGSIADCWPWTDHEANAEFIAASREDIPYLLQLVTEQREVLDSAVRFIESALVICARSCNPGDGLHVSWGEDICKAARALGPLNALEKLQQETEAKGYRKRGQFEPTE